MNLDQFDDPPTLRRPRGIVACSDGYCGAWDCPRCHGENFDADMNYVGDDDDNAALTSADEGGVS